MANSYDNIKQVSFCVRSHKNQLLDLKISSKHTFSVSFYLNHVHRINECVWIIKFSSYFILFFPQLSMFPHSFHLTSFPSSSSTVNHHHQHQHYIKVSSVYFIANFIWFNAFHGFSCNILNECCYYIKIQ